MKVPLTRAVCVFIVTATPLAAETVPLNELNTVALATPATSKGAVGAVVPIPTLPLDCIRILSASALLDVVKNAKLPSNAPAAWVVHCEAIDEIVVLAPEVEKVVNAIAEKLLFVKLLLRNWSE